MWDASESDEEGSERGDDVGSPGYQLIWFLLGLLAKCTLNAKDFCIICYWAARAGAAGDCSVYGKAPGRQTGAYQRHLDKLLPARPVEGAYYRLSVPQSTRQGLNRVSREIPVVIPYEALTREFEVTPALREGIDERTRDRDWEKAYNEHPSVKRAIERRSALPEPLALYLDGIRFTRQTSAGRVDTMLLFTIYSLTTCRRHLIAAVRKSAFCKCGCKGWCTIYPILLFIAWAIAAMDAGRRPATRHDGSPWEGVWAEIAGSALPFQAVLLDVKGDWAEFCHSLGFPTWQSWFHPCFCCGVRRDALYNFGAITMLDTGWGDAVVYEQACAQCEIIVWVTEEVRGAIMGIGELFYDKRERGYGGRALRNDVVISDQLTLRAGDRLEPTPELVDVGEFETKPVPYRAKFWRRRLAPDGACMDAVNHRNPLFSEELGTSPERTLAIDTLHTLYSGVIMRFNATAIWAVIESNPWQCQGTEEVQHDRTLGLIRAHQENWYKRNDVPPDMRLGCLTMAMIGDKEAPELKTKAAETGILLGWAIALLGEHERAVHMGTELLASGNALASYMELLDASPRVVDFATCTKLLDYCLRHLILFGAAGGVYTPKHHLFVHMTLKIEVHGNPKHHSTFVDETLNGAVALVAGKAHRANWESRIFERVALHGLVVRRSRFWGCHGRIDKRRD